MDKLLTIKETQKILNVSKTTLQRWDNGGKLMAVRTEGGHRRYRESDINKLINTKDNVSYGSLYEHLCSAQYIADKLGDDNANNIMNIKEKIGKKLLDEFNKNK